MTIVIADAPPLAGIRQRIQQLSDRFAKILGTSGGRLYYIDDPGNLVTVFISPEKPVSNLWSWMRNPRMDESGITHWIPPAELPFGYHSRPINQWNHLLYRIALGSRYRPSDGPVLLIVCNVLGLGWLGRLGEDYVIYDCADEISEFRQASLKRDAVLAQERELISRADAVVTTAQSLLEKKSEGAKRSKLIRNAADVGHFRSTITEDWKIPSDLENLQKPVVGYIGFLAEWLNWPLIKHVVENGQEFEWVFIGPASRNLAEFESLPNFHWLGKKPYDELPAYLSHFSCAHIPFDLTPLTVHVNPVKLYEYLASGLPVVATPLPELDAYRDVCEITNDPDEYLEAVRWAVENDSALQRNERCRRVENETWDARISEYCELINELVGSGRNTS